MKTIESKIVGTLTENETVENLWTGAPITIPMLDEDLPVSFIGYVPEKDLDFIEQADQALTHFQQLNGFYKLEIAQLVFENFVEFCAYVDETGIPAKMKGAQPLSIWTFVYPTAVFVSRRAKNDQDLYVILACECEWEKEHGLQLVFRQGKKLTRVSDQDGHLTTADAYGLPDDQDELLSNF